MSPGEIEGSVEVASGVGPDTDQRARALLPLWDMVKYLEKDTSGKYPITRIYGIRITKKEKRRNRP